MFSDLLTIYYSPLDLLVKTDLPCIQKVLYKPQEESDQPY